MRKILAISLITYHLSLITSLCSAQLTLLHKFNDTAGAIPQGPLTKFGNLLYGMTPRGGANGDGCIFSLDTNGRNYKDIFDFNGTNGTRPLAGLVLSGNKFYGMASGGGAHGNGCIFSINTSGSGYIDRFDFNGTNGSGPLGNLTPSGNILYGMAGSGGVHDSGCVFSIDTTGSNYIDLLDFTGTNGKNPSGTLTLAGNVLYGPADYGGLNDRGCVFSIHTDGTSYKDMYDFTQTRSKPYLPSGKLCLLGSMLYGFASYANGADAMTDHASLYKIDTNGTGFKVLVGYIDRDQSSLIMINNLFFYMTGFGVAYPHTGLYSVDTAGHTFQLCDFPINYPKDSDGYSSCNYLMNSGNVIYGTNGAGGDRNNDGTIFKFQLLSVNAVDSGRISCYGGNNGVATAIVSGSYPPFTYVWSPGGATTAMVTGLTRGSYTVTVTDAKGDVAVSSVIITQPTALTVTPHIISNLTCYRSNNGNVSSAVLGGTLPYTYLWSNGHTTFNITGQSAGTYILNVTDNSGCSETASVTVTQPTIVFASITKTIPLCNGSSNGSMVAAGTGGTPPYTSYVWAPYGGTTTTATGLSAQTYTLVITDSKGCTGTDVVGLGQPTAITVSIPTFTCVVGGKGTVVANPAGGTPAYHYTWSNGTSTVGTLKTEIFPNGSYTVSVTDNHGCPPAIGTITISGCPTIKMESEEIPDAGDNSSLAKVNIYPNPSKGVFTILFSHPALDAGSQAIIEIYDVLGRKVTFATLNQVQDDNLIDLSNQPNGVYLYRVIANNGNVLGEGKLVIQK